MLPAVRTDEERQAVVWDEKIVSTPRELLACTLLHVHGNLPECLRELPAPPDPTLDSLALTWFGTA